MYMFCIYCKHYALAIHCKNCHANKAHIELNLIELRERDVRTLANALLKR